MLTTQHASTIVHTSTITESISYKMNKSLQWNEFTSLATQESDNYGNSSNQHVNTHIQENNSSFTNSEQLKHRSDSLKIVYTAVHINEWGVNYQKQELSLYFTIIYKGVQYINKHIPSVRKLLNCNRKCCPVYAMNHQQFKIFHHYNVQ